MNRFCHIPSLSLYVMLLLGAGAMQAQEAPPLRFGLGYTGNAYRGDLTAESGSLWRAEPGANLSVDANRGKKLGVQLNLGFGGFTEQADEPLSVAPDDIQPNAFVRTSFTYTDIRLQYRLFPDHIWTPYLSAGAGLFSFQPRDAEGNFLGENLFSRLPEEEYLTLIASVPLSAGLEWKLNRSLALGAEYTFRYTGSDYLDNIGKLGPAAGPDQLHALQLKMLLSVGQRPPAPEPGAFEPAPVQSVEEVAPQPLPPVYYRHKDGQLRRRQQG